MINSCASFWFDLIGVDDDVWSVRSLEQFQGERLAELAWNFPIDDHDIVCRTAELCLGLFAVVGDVAIEAVGRQRSDGELPDGGFVVDNQRTVGTQGHTRTPAQTGGQGFTGHANLAQRSRFCLKERARRRKSLKRHRLELA